MVRTALQNMQQTQALNKIKIKSERIKMMMRMSLGMLEDGGGWGGSVNTLSVSIIRERLTFDHTVDYDHGGVQQDQELYQLLYKHNNS